ncbi:MAG: phosphotransferase [Deltaproteobacteria bacterium]|jgi:aminoglycoside/choline kinase family phosphotransferase|nr:phosphotransferase [Deltaproteobacteria bacterium]
MTQLSDTHDHAGAEAGGDRWPALEWAAGRWGVDPAGIAAARLPGDASPRGYARLKSAGETRILMEGPDRLENRAWLSVGRRLWEAGFPVPEIHDWDLDLGYFLLEDLGDSHLCDLEGKDCAAFAAAAKAASETLASFHDRAWECLAPVHDLLQARYDSDFMLRSEWNYFLEGARLLGVPGSSGKALAAEGRKLAALSGCERERSFIHRDYQSRNILVTGRGVRIIDWQGGRLGPPFYDLASLLYDPYTDLGPADRSGLVADYLAARKTPASGDEYLDKTRFFGLVRLMQAAGAYAHLAARGLTSYARFLPRALGRSLEIALELPQGVFPGVVGFLEGYQARLPRILSGLGVCAL